MSSQKHDSSDKFVGSSPGMQSHIYDYKPGAYFGTDQCETNATMLIDLCCSTLHESSALRYCLTELVRKQITKPTMATSVPAKDPTSMQCNSLIITITLPRQATVFAHYTLGD